MKRPMRNASRNPVAENSPRKRAGREPRERIWSGERPAARAGWGDLESRNRLVQQHLGLVHRIAREYVRRGLTFEDLVGEGNLGLIRAAQRYDSGVGTRFSTYADYWIREAIRTGLANTAPTIRVPMNVSKLLGRWRRTEKSLGQLRGYPPTFEEVATDLGLDEATQRLVAKAIRVERLQSQAVRRTDLRSPTLSILDESDTAEETLTAREEREAVSDRLGQLDEPGRTIVFLKYGLSGEPPMGFEEIARRLRLSIRAAQKTFAVAIRKLGRHPEVPGACGRRAYDARVG
jgi:RNA polymerase primary sigma factor